MLKAIRYTLAAICLTASVGCLALWWRSMTRIEYAGCVISSAKRAIHIATDDGMVNIYFPMTLDPSNWQLDSQIKTLPDPPWEDRFPIYLGRLGPELYFPLWYPALVFALAAVAAIRIRRITLRSALVCVSVVAALLGMVVVL